MFLCVLISMLHGVFILFLLYFSFFIFLIYFVVETELLCVSDPVSVSYTFMVRNIIILMLFLREVKRTLRIL